MKYRTFQCCRGRPVLKPKRSGLSNEHFEMLVFLKYLCFNKYLFFELFLLHLLLLFVLSSGMLIFSQLT